MARRNLFSDFMRVRFTNKPNPMDQVPVKSDNEDIVSKLEDAEASGTSLQSMAALDEFRTIAQDRQSQYNAYDEMATDSVIAAALESYADDATVEDEQGRVIWVESENKEIADSANRLLDILEIPERAWKHIYMACKYGDYYLKFNRVKQDKNAKPEDQEITLQHSSNVKIVNDKEIYQNTRYTPTYEEYIEDMPDPAVIFDLQEHGKTAGFIEVHGSENDNIGMGSVSALTYKFQKNDVKIYPADAMIHIAISETMNRTPETVTLQFDENTSTTYDVKRGKSTLYDVYPIEKTVQLLEDSLSLNRLTRSSIIRILEVEVGNKPQNEINATLRRVKNSIEQKIAMDKNAGRYQSYQSPGPIDNILYFPTKNGKGSINVNTIGGDVNVRDIADIDYFNNKRAAALKIPKAYLGEDMEGCLRGDTKLLLLNGKHISIKELYENKEEYLGKGIMSCNSDGELVPTTIKAIKLTRKNADYVRVTLDNGKYFDVTPDHLCMLRDGSFAEASDLEVGESLMPLYDKVKDGRRYVWDNLTQKWLPQYRLVAKTKYGELKEGYQIHHENLRKIDDDFDNLTQLTFREHYDKHSDNLHKLGKRSLEQHKLEDPEWWEETRKKFGRPGVPFTEEHKKNISKALKGKPSNHPFAKGENNPSHHVSKETRRKLSEASTGRTHSEEAKRKISLANKGKVVSDETRERLSRSLKGRVGTFLGRHHSDETKAKLSESISKAMSGEGNSCYGKKLVNNGVSQRYILKEELDEFLANNPDWELGGKKRNAPYNHKVVSVEYLDGVVEDAYDIEVENESHTFILDAGVFVHNSGLSNGGSLTRQSIKYARVIQRIQRAYIRAITTMLNLFFYDKGLDYINKFEVRMTSPSTQEDLERNELVNGNIDLVKNIMDLTDSLEGDTQKNILIDLINNVMKMPDIASIIKKDTTPEEEIDIDVTGSRGGAPSFAPSGGDEGPVDMSSEFESPSTEFEPETETTSGEAEFTDQEYQNFMDNEL